MKKSKLSIGLVTSFIGALALTACNESAASVTKSSTSAVDIIGYNGDTDKIEINIDELYREYGTSKEGTTAFYNAVLEVLTRYEYKYVWESDHTLKDPTRIASEAKDKLRAVQQTARDNAKNNGTDYDEEWDKILDSNNVKTTKALELKFVYELEKDALSDWYYKAHSESIDREYDDGERSRFMVHEHVSGLREQYLGVSNDWNEVTGKTANVDSVYPYHILHVLVKLSADKDDYIRGTITKDEATKLWQVVRMLLDSKFTWTEVAKLSDDTSKDSFGDVGIMSTQTSFYNEFKLGIYAYDALLSGVNTLTDKNGSIYDAFGIGKDLNGLAASVTTEKLSNGTETKELVTDLVQKTMVEDVNYHLDDASKSDIIPTIPFDVFRQIGLAADKEKIDNFEPEGSSASLPRNVLFNAFLNFHSPFVITNELLDQSSVSFTDDYVKTTEYDFDGDGDSLIIENTNFKENKVKNLGKKVLCDAEGNVVIGVRSEAGIHFMVMRKSVFEETNKAVGKQNTSLLDYYTTAVPGDEDFPATGQTYVNMKGSDDISYYTNRANTIKSDIKSTSTFDPAWDYRIYETLMDFEIDGKKMSERLTFFDEDKDEGVDSEVKENIAKTISLLRESSHESKYESINSAWRTYLLMLMNQNLRRSDDGYFKNAFVKTTCAFKFDENNKEEWKEGGKCYVK